MLISKKITIIKYLGLNSLFLGDYLNKIKVAYKLNSNSTYLKWNSFSYSIGLSVDFETLDYNQGYIIISNNFPYNLGSDGDFYDIVEESIVQNRQICSYKGSNLNIFAFSQIYNIQKVYKISNNGNNYLKWDKNFANLGLSNDFENFSNGENYLIFTNETSYILWPPQNFNKSSAVDKRHFNWGLKEHTT